MKDHITVGKQFQATYTFAGSVSLPGKAAISIGQDKISIFAECERSVLTNRVASETQRIIESGPPMPRQEWKRWGGGVKEEVKWVIGNCQGTMSSSIFSNIEVSERSYIDELESWRGGNISLSSERKDWQQKQMREQWQSRLLIVPILVHRSR